MGGSVAEFLKVSAVGEDYEDALSKCFIRMKDICGHPTAQIFRNSPGRIEAVPLIDWILDQTDGCVSPGGTSICVEASFFLLGSDGEDSE